ncbi:MAG TPA: helix-turn-helix transcriptional regulator [Micromonosporaceae bacterium]|jgi:transcriptional regulator with XRE-family HTH domain
MVLLRRVIGDALRARRQGQHRTLREVSTAANVSLGYLSEIERGQKEASSELLASICEALGAQLSEVLREASDTLALAEDVEGVLVPVDSVAKDSGERRQPVRSAAATQRDAAAPAARKATDGAVRTVTEGNVSVSVRQDTPLKATLRATRHARPADRGQPGDRGRDVVYAA